MTRPSTEPVTVVVMAPILAADVSFLGQIDPALGVIDGNDAFLAETQEDDPQAASPQRSWSRAERDDLIGRADVLVVGYPVPRQVAGRAPRLRWVHHTQAGVSNFHRSDLWESNVMLTSGRGTVAVRSIAEYAIAAVLFFARGFDEAARQKRAATFQRDGYKMRSVEGATVGIIGLGGIGSEVGRLAKALGMRVVATRRSQTQPASDVDGVDLPLPASHLLEVAAQSDFLVVCSQLTDETRGMIDRSVLAAMKPGAALVNIARGEEVDEEALLEAVGSGRLLGAVLDVHEGEPTNRPLRQALLDSPRILVTPHISGLGDGRWAEAGRRLVADNLRRFLGGRPLRNVVDRSLGY